MKKNTFYALAFILTFILVALLEASGSNSEELSRAEAKSVISVYRESEINTIKIKSQEYNTAPSVIIFNDNK